MTALCRDLETPVERIRSLILLASRNLISDPRLSQSFLSSAEESLKGIVTLIRCQGTAKPETPRV